MIVVGYQGIGKSTYACADNDAIDLESSNFYLNGKRPEGWEKMYVKIAKHLSDQGYDVFISAHKEARDELKKIQDIVDVAAIVPALNDEMKQKWIKRLKDRWYGSDCREAKKTYAAYKHADEYYEDDIKGIMNDIKNVVILESMDYDLRYKIKDLKYAIKTSKVS